MDKKAILKKILAKLEKEQEKVKLTKKDVLDILYKYVNKYDLAKENYSRKILINQDKLEELRTIYDNAKVKKLYTYSLNKFGFVFENIRVDVEPHLLSITVLNEEGK
jgi:hypothetical protein